MTPARTLLVPSGVLIRGANITTGAQHTSGWRQFWAEWDWSGWIKPQIDSAALLGANTVRCLGSADGVLGGYVNRQTYISRWRQLIDYCGSKGLMVYPCGGSLRYIGSATQSQVISLLTEWAVECAKSPSVIGLDITNEVLIALTLKGMQPVDIYNYIKAMTLAVKGSCNLAVTHDITVHDTSQWFDLNTPKMYPFIDYWDFHSYYDGIKKDDLSGLLSSEYGDKPVLIGEFGAAMDLSSSARTARYTDMASLVSGTPQVLGALAWAAADTDVTDFNQWGLVDLAWSPRTDITVPYATIPTTR